jgi:hypothetical protein
MKEIIFIDKRPRRQLALLPPMADIIRATSLKILGVSITNDLSASGHVHDVTGSSAQILHAVRVSCARGMNNTALQAIFGSTVVAKLQLYAASFITCSLVSSRRPIDRQRAEAFLRRSKKCSYCLSALPTFEEQCDSVDQKLFDNILANQDHLLSNLYFLHLQ